MFASCQRLDLFAVAARERQRNYVLVRLSRLILKTHCTVCVPTLAMFAYFSDMFGNGGQPFDQMLRETANMEIPVMSFVCSIRASESQVPSLFLPSRF